MFRKNRFIAKQALAIILFLVLLVTATFSSAQQVTITLPHIMAPGGPADQAVKRFAELALERSDGRIVVNDFPGGSLGGEREILEGLRINTYQMMFAGEMAIEMYAAEYAGVLLPYLYRDLDHLRAVLNGEVGQDMMALWEERGNILTFAPQARGARHLTTNRSVESVADLQGMRMRLPEVPLWMAVWRELGAQPTPIPFPEVFGALQTGVVEAQENPFELIYTSRFYEVQDYLVLTGHVRGSYFWHINKTFFEGLSPEDQEIIREAAIEAAAYGDALQIEMDEEFEQELRERMEFIELDEEAFAEFQAAALRVAEQEAHNWVDNLVEDVLAH